MSIMDPYGGTDAPSRHKCLIYEGDPSEQLPVVIPLLMDGLEDHWRCLYLGSPEMVRMVSDALATRGVDTEREMRRGSLVFSSDRDHIVNGAFHPNAMVEKLCASVDDAVRDGFRGLCATGDMRWELGVAANFDRLLEYEALLERAFRDKPLRGICQYHRDLLPEAAVRDALLTHRSAFVGKVFNHDNLFYVPPELLLENGKGDTAAKHGEWMCRQILRVVEAERARDRALLEQRRLAEELAAVNRDLERRVAERVTDLTVANRHLQAFSYSVSHDLRAPLRAIRGFGAILTEDFSEGLGEQGRRTLERVCSNADRMDQLIDGLLAMGRVVNAPMSRAPVDLTALAEDVAREARLAAPQRSVDLAVEAGLRATGDAVLLRAAMTNLVGNALKFTSKREDARIQIGQRGEEEGKRVFFVKDNGVGFDMRYAKNLFGVFQRLHRQDEFPGDGVGLATVERIVSRHGGRIWAESRPDAGATFLFTLPGADPGT